MIVVLTCTAFVAYALAADGEEHISNMYGTIWALLPPVVAIVLALITKEVYTSLFVGILVGALFYANWNPELTINAMFFSEGGLVMKLGDSWNMGILVFLVILGILVCLMNKAGGSAAFGRWAQTHIKTRTGAQLATMLLGVLIFVDDYFNCLTVGSVMRPVTDGHKISRAKLAYLIDATAAPVCIIAPISSWAAAVTSSVPEGSGINGFQMFIQSIPYNFYALLTLLMIIVISVLKFDYGPMRQHEANAMKGDLFTFESRPYGDGTEDAGANPKGRVIDLVLPVIFLVFACIMGMVYTGGFFSGTGFVDAFAASDASVGLVLGSFAALIFAFIYYMCRRVMSFKEFSEAIPAGFKAMVPAILILAFAWTLSGMTGLLGGAEYVKVLVEGSAEALQSMLPAIIFLVAVILSFSTGTSWGTFGILIPIVVNVFPAGEMLTLTIAACLAGAVCGDHCSPISDTTIMSSAGAQSDHIAHVSTQLPYALTVAAVCFVSYIIAGFARSVLISLPLALIMMLVTLIIIRAATKEKQVLADNK
jgi:Na+/H+ antiporter NhaC